MKEISLEQGAILAPFFTDTYDSCCDSFIHGIMGKGFTDSDTNPTYGVIQVGDFLFFGGNGDGPLKQNVVHILKTLFHNPEMIMVPLSRSWYQTLEENESLERLIRYSLNQPGPENFNEGLLARHISKVCYDPEFVDANSSRKYVIKPIDENLFISLPKQDWSKDFVSNYKDYAFFQQYGLGFVIIEGSTSQIVAGASSFSSSKDAIEIQIATNPAYRKRGFATAVSARMIIECCRKGLRPSWDAANLTSVSIAERLGYHFNEEYIAYMCK